MLAHTYRAGTSDCCPILCGLTAAVGILAFGGHGSGSVPYPEWGQVKSAPIATRLTCDLGLRFGSAIWDCDLGLRLGGDERGPPD